MPPFGPRVHPSSDELLLLVKEGICYCQLMPSAKREEHGTISVLITHPMVAKDTVPALMISTDSSIEVTKSPIS